MLREIFEETSWRFQIKFDEDERFSIPSLTIIHIVQIIMDIGVCLIHNLRVRKDQMIMCYKLKRLV